MNTGKQSKPQRVDQIDPAFDPWEQSRPIPLFLLALFIALAVWGAFSYINDLHPVRDNELGQITEPLGPQSPDPAAPLLVTQGNDAVWSCASCHGARGEGAGLTPRLAALPQTYLAKQLQDFANGSRLNGSMRYVAQHLEPADIEAVARYYASLPVPPPPARDLGAALERGEALSLYGDWKLNIPACVTCHGPNGEGVGADFPPLAGQQPEYLFNQLAAWKGGERHNSPQRLMDDIASRMSDQDMWAIAQYFGSIRP